MASHEQPYDPYLPSGRSGTPGAASYHHEGTDRTAALQAVSPYSPIQHTHKSCLPQSPLYADSFLANR